jgi:hypothetical protein
MSGDGLRAIALVAGLVAVPGCNRFTGPSPVDGPWRVVETTHFALHVRPGSFAEQHVATFGDVLEDQRTVSLDRLGVGSEGRLLGFFYNFAGEGGLESSREGVAYPLTQSFKLVASPPLDANLFVLMSHEANHVIARQVLGRPGTSFVNEGLASALLSERYHQMGPSYLHRWCAETSGLPPVTDLIDDDKWSGLDYERKYNASASFLAFLLERYGAEPFRLIYGASSRQLRDRFGEAYGIGLDQAEAEWQEFLRQQ